MRLAPPGEQAGFGEHRRVGFAAHDIVRGESPVKRHRLTKLQHQFGSSALKRLPRCLRRLGHA